MILRGNLPRLVETARAGMRVLDVGGWQNPFGPATHVIDLGRYETRQKHDSLPPGEAERFTDETWHIQDVCAGGWPYPDKFFDFAICSHLLEDVREPLVVCRELARVAKRGYVEVPSRAREIFAKARFFGLRASFGNVPEVGFYHHRWMVEIEGAHLRFLRKTHQLVMNRDFCLTRRELGRKMTEAESGICLWWDGDFTAEEIFEVSDHDLRAFKRQALAALRR
ncbi:MAG: methyltransferase domain-containing protein [Alphaproteobacteria bacterium]|nr:methyltransferase domain-containing protein [Alphaproteobacteria bacterium]